MSNGTKDNILELITAIESQGFKYVVGILKPDKDDKLHTNIEIFTNTGDNPLENLLTVLKEYKKTQKQKLKDNTNEQPKNN